jgi:hypothetical protein
MRSVMKIENSMNHKSRSFGEGAAGPWTPDIQKNMIVENIDIL